MKREQKRRTNDVKKYNNIIWSAWKWKDILFERIEEHIDFCCAYGRLYCRWKIIGSSPTEFTLVDYPTMDDRSVMNLKSSDRLKQEIDNEQGLILFKFQ